MPPSQGEKKETGPSSNIDLGKILLPKKETGPNPESAQRVNAGALLASEQSAELPKPEPSGPLVPLVPKPPTPAEGAPAPVAVAPVPALTPKATPAPLAPPTEEPSEVQALQTYRSDIESVVEDKNISVVNIAAAEAERRGEEGLPQPASTDKSRSLSVAMILGGALLIAAAVALIAFFFMRPTSVAGPTTPQAPFMTVDSSTLVTIEEGATRETLMTQLQAARVNARVSLGLIEWVYVARPAITLGEAPQELSAADLVSLVSPNAPAGLMRTLEPTYLLGVHSFDENQPFLILQVDSYGTAYAGMLEWERTMRGDLSPLFSRSPSPRLVAPEPPPVFETATSTASSTGSTTPQAVPIEIPFIQTGFVDKIVENRDTRAVLNDAGDLLLLWTFLGRNSIVITTNEYTLREVVSRINVAPTIPTPGQ